MTKTITINGFWKERLDYINNLPKDKKPDPDDFDACGFDFAGGAIFVNKNGDEDYYEICDFLHGSCNIFAQCLNKTYNYPIEAIYENNQLIHMYCVDDSDPENRIYIDVRGKCNDFDYFMKEFYDNGLYNGALCKKKLYKSVKDIPKTEQLKNKTEMDYIQYAEQIIKEYNYYQP